MPLWIVLRCPEQAGAKASRLAHKHGKGWQAKLPIAPCQIQSVQMQSPAYCVYCVTLTKNSSRWCQDLQLVELQPYALSGEQCHAETSCFQGCETGRCRGPAAPWQARELLLWTEWILHNNLRRRWGWFHDLFWLWFQLLTVSLWGLPDQCGMRQNRSRKGAPSKEVHCKPRRRSVEPRGSS